MPVINQLLHLHNRSSLNPVNTNVRLYDSTNKILVYLNTQTLQTNKSKYSYYMFVTNNSFNIKNNIDIL